MGLTYLPPSDLPPDNSIVWCRWPYKLRAGEVIVSRPVLVRRTMINQDIDGTIYGAVVVAYGTGELWQANADIDLVIETNREARELGLHKPTAFILSQDREKVMVWCEEKFVAPPYNVTSDILIGELDIEQIARLRERLARRGR